MYSKIFFGNGNIRVEQFDIKMKDFTKILIIIVTSFLTGACKNNTSPKNTMNFVADTFPFHIVTDNVPQFAKQNQLDSILNNLSYSDHFLFTDLYPIIEILPPAHEDHFILASRLEELGFEQIDGGRGNWEKGPRFYYCLYEKDSLQCRVYKMYQLNEMNEDSCYNMVVYEQIECLKK